MVSGKLPLILACPWGGAIPCSGQMVVSRVKAGGPGGPPHGRLPAGLRPDSPGRFARFPPLLPIPLECPFKTPETTRPL
jgi:hypothetical protein